MRQLPREGAHTVSLLFAVSRLFICLPLEGAGCRWQPLSVSSEAPTEAAAVTEGVKFQFVGDDAHIVPNEETMDFTGFTVGRGLAPAVLDL